MRALWALYWSVCLLRRGPESMPRSPGLLVLALLLDLALGLTVQRLSEPVSAAAALGIVLLAVLLEAAVLWGLARFTRREVCYLQALTTLYGVDFLLGLAALPLVVAGVVAGKSPWLGAALALQLPLLGWNLGVRSFVYHRALGIGVLQASMLVLTLFLLHVTLAAQLFPELLAPAPAH